MTAPFPSLKQEQWRYADLDALRPVWQQFAERLTYVSTRALNREGLAYLQNTFAELGLAYTPSYGNFVLVKVGDGDALFAYAMRKGVILRAMRAYKLPEYVRVSVGTMPQNEKFVRVLREWLKEQG